MMSFRQLMIRSFPRIRRFSGSTKRLLAQKSVNSQDKKVIVPVKVPFLPDRSGLIPMETIPQLTEISVNIINRSETTLKPLSDFKENSLIVVAKTQAITIYPELYKHMKTNDELSIHVSLRDVGKKSFNNQFDIYDDTNTVLLCRNIRSLVVCDMETKPVPIPEPALTMIKSYVTHDDRFFCPKPFSIKPEDVFTTTVIPRPSDLDILYHVNQSNYLKFMLDAAVPAAKAGVYNCLKQDIAFSLIDQIILDYSRELRFNDHVTIETWQDQEDPMKICFEMTAHSQLAFQGSITLQEPLLKLSPKIKQKLPRAQEF